MRLDLVEPEEYVHSGPLSQIYQAETSQETPSFDNHQTTFYHDIFTLKKLLIFNLYVTWF